MYEAFYGFKEKPFSMLPDPGFLFLSKKHQAALALLEYGVLNQVGFCVISGEPGAGKTTILRALLERVADDVSVGLITNTHQSFGGLLDWVLSAFNLHQPNLTHVEMHQIFMDYLIAEYGKNRRVLLIVDEAQNMQLDVLEELRMLSNVNSEKDQLMQVILSGQPALKETLRKPELMQFAQRIAVDFHLEPLNLEETCGYIQHRLVTAGAEKDVFTPAACERIFSYSGGTPRLINLLCETVLVYGFADQRELIDVDLVDEMVLERMKDSVVPIVNRDIAKQANKKTSEELEKDFPWIRPEGGTQGLKPEQHVSADRKVKSATKSARKQKKAASKTAAKAAANATESSAVKKTAADADSDKAKSSVAGKDKNAEGEDVKKTPANDKPGGNAGTARQPEKPPVKPVVKQAVTEQKSAEPDIDILATGDAAVLQENEAAASYKFIMYGVIVAIITLVIIFFFTRGLSDEARPGTAETKKVLELQKQREQERAALLQLQNEAEILRKERDAAIAKAEEDARLKKQAEILAAEKAATEKAALAAKLKAEEEKRVLEEKKRLAEEKKKQSLAKKQAAEAKAKQEVERIRREAELLEKERLELKLRLEEEMRLKQQEETRRLELEWQEKQRLAVQQAEEKAKAKAEAAAAASEKAAEETIKAKSKLAECSGPTARFKANCR